MICYLKNLQRFFTPSLQHLSAAFTFWLPLGLSGVLFVACASPKPPTYRVIAAETAIAHADEVQISDYNSPDLAEARQKLTAARAAIAEKDMVNAARLAHQSQLGAELATARAGAVKAQLVNDEMQKSTSVLNQEMQRNSGAPK